MDFLTIAESTSPKAIQRFVRSLTSTATAAEDDDFSHLDTSHTSHHDFVYQSDSILDNTMKNTNFDKLENTPIFGPAAEGELFMLATNFLLCESCIYFFFIWILRSHEGLQQVKRMINFSGI